MTPIEFLKDDGTRGPDRWFDLVDANQRFLIEYSLSEDQARIRIHTSLLGSAPLSALRLLPRRRFASTPASTSQQPGYSGFLRSVPNTGPVCRVRPAQLGRAVLAICGCAHRLDRAAAADTAAADTATAEATAAGAAAAGVAAAGDS